MPADQPDQNSSLAPPGAALERLPPPPPPPPAERAPVVSRGPLTYLAILTILALLGALLYLLAERNTRRFYLTADDDQLVVRKGLWFLAGACRYEPGNPEEAELYRPVPIPPNTPPFVERRYDDLMSLNVGLAGLLVDWAGPRLHNPKAPDFKLALDYLTRAAHLPGLPASLHEQIRNLRAQTAYTEGLDLMRDIEPKLAEAIAKFKQAKALGHSEPLEELERWISLGELLVGRIKNPRAETAPFPATAGQRLTPEFEAAPATAAPQAH